MSNSSASSGGIGFLGLLTIVFITLKLIGFLDDWSWWQVTSPLWVPLAIILVIAWIALVAWCCLKLLKDHR